MKGQSSFGTGDINLAAALTTMGMPPDPRIPIELVAKDDGRDYIRFHFGNNSICGKYTVSELSRAWGDSDRFKQENPMHPFSLIMDMISRRPFGCSSKDDWLLHVSQTLGIPIDAVHKTYQGIARACAAAPESPLSYLCAFVRNRIDLIHATKRKEAAGDFTTMQSKGKSVSMIHAKAPARIRDFILSHIR